MTMGHGHHWARGKSFTWWAEQTFNNQPAGNSQILAYAHEHSYSVQSKRERVAICTSTFESESTWWRHKHGDLSKRGAAQFTTVGPEMLDLMIA
jgi:hypothetical protein